MEQRLTAALAETARLRVENERIRKILRIRKACPEIVPASEMKGTQPSVPLLTADEKIRLFGNLFRGREEVYAVRWKSRDGNKPERVALDRPNKRAFKETGNFPEEWLSQASQNGKIILFTGKTPAEPLFMRSPE